MSVFKIVLHNPKAYLNAISGVTHLTPKESELLAEIIEFMRIKKLKVIDDEVKEHIMKVANYPHRQCYYNLIASLKKKKLIVNSRKKMELRPMLHAGTTLEITFEDPIQETKLKIYEDLEEVTH